MNLQVTPRRLIATAAGMKVAKIVVLSGKSLKAKRTRRICLHMYLRVWQIDDGIAMKFHMIYSGMTSARVCFNIAVMILILKI